MTIEVNKKVIVDFFDKFNTGNISEAFNLVSETATWWIPGTLPFSGTKNKAQYLQIVSSIQAGFPNGFTLTVKGMIAENDTVAVEVESYGEYTNGELYQNKYHFLFKLHLGKIVLVKEYMDTLHLKELLK